MSECAGDIIEKVLRITRRQNSEDDRRSYWRMLNTIYFRLCKKYSWATLRRTMTIDFTTMPDDTGMWLPSNLFGIDSVLDFNNGFEYYNRDRADLDEDEAKYRFYTYIPSELDGFFGDDCSVASGGTIITSAQLVANGTDFTGYYAKFGSELGHYKLTSASAFTPTYYGEAVEIGDIRIRPKDTLKILTIDPTEELLDDNKVYVHYWQAPQPLYKDSDEICIPNGKILEVMLLRELPEAKAYRPVSEGEIDKVMTETLAMNPSVEYSKPKRDKIGAMFKFNSGNYFKQRG